MIVTSINVSEITRSLQNWMKERAKELAKKHALEIEKELIDLSVRAALEVSPFLQTDICSPDIIIKVGKDVEVKNEQRND